MDQEVNTPTVIPPRPPKKESIINNKVSQWFLIIFLLVASTIVAVFFYYNDQPAYEVPQPQVDLVQRNVGETVDYATYIQIHNLTLATKYKPDVVESSLRSFDIDGDGDLDILGFRKLQTSYNDTSTYIFTTWHMDGLGYTFYEDDYDDFRQYEDVDAKLSCSIYNLEIRSITLSCPEIGNKYLVTLKYQDNGTGYYRDVDAQSVTYDSNSDWPEYVSKNGGLRFHYPPDVQLSEKTYEVYGELITIITAERDGQLLFESKTSPGQGFMGGGVIDIGSKTVFLKLPDNSYLSRHWMGGEPNPYETGVFYIKTIPYNINNVEAVGALFDESNTVNGRDYTLFSSIMDENVLKELDSIFASINYVSSPAVKDAQTIIIQNKTVYLGNAVTLSIPGQITEKEISYGNENDLAQKNFDISFIPSPIFQPSSLNLELLPFVSVGPLGIYGAGGYNVEQRGCLSTRYDNDAVTIPQLIGANQVCKFGYGDGGFGATGYYVIDRYGRYIVKIENRSGYTENYESISPDLEAIAGSVRFLQ